MNLGFLDTILSYQKKYTRFVDSSEMPKQPSRSGYNSLASAPLKTLTIGLYRTGFTTYKTGEVKSICLAEVADPIKLSGSSKKPLKT